MSSIEERLVQDIAAVTGGIVMTDAELRDARNEMDERIDKQRPPRRRSTYLAAVAAAAVVAVLGVVAFQTLGDDDKTAPAPAPVPDPTPADPDADFLNGDAPTAELVQGVWRVDDGKEVILFGADGRVSIDNVGQLFGGPVAQGTYELDGDLITVTLDQGPAGCDGRELLLRASVQGPGAMRYVGTGSDSGDCSPLRDGRWALEQVLPAGPSMAGLVFSTDPDFSLLQDASTLEGVWMAEGGGYVLEIHPDGSYVVVDDSLEPVDQGQWALQGSDLTLTSSAASTQCAEGDLLVWTGVEQTVPGASIGMRQTLQSDDCGGAWAAKAWILIPHVGM